MRSPKQVAVFGSFLTSAYAAEYKMAEDLGALLAQNGFRVVCGGHGGIADSLVAGVMKGGGEVLGVSLAKSKYPDRSARMNPLITERFDINSASERLEFFSNSDGFVFFTGGIGTLSEFSFVWHSLQLEADFDRPVVLLSKSWKRILAKIRQEQMVKQKYYRTIHLCERVKDAVAVVADDYSIKYDDPVAGLHKKTVLFELDGVIVESPEEEFARLCEDVGWFFPMSDVVEASKAVGSPRGLMEKNVPCYLGMVEHLGVTAKAAAGVADHVCRGSKELPALYGDVVDALRALRGSGFSTGVVSGRHPSQRREILAAHKLSALFDFAGTPEHAAGKPDRGVVGGALENAGFSRGGAVYIGGGFHGTGVKARAGGIDTILLDRYLTHILDEEVIKIRSLKELKSLVKYDAAAGGGKPDCPGC